MAIVMMTYVHYLGMALLFSALLMEAVLFRPRVEARTARLLAGADALYGGAFLAVLATGLMRVFFADKPAAYYGHNFLFHIKVTLFLVVGAISIYPAIQFLRRRRTPEGEQVEYPAGVGTLIKVELVLLAIIPLLAVMMARGYGITG